MKIDRRITRFYAGVFLTLLLSAQIGQKLHIYNEDHRHFAAFSGDLVADNGAQEQVSERCVVDNYPFFSFLTDTAFTPVFYVQMAAIILPLATQCKQVTKILTLHLRAPPTI